jgi:tripartite-type tricarboxylate transporter receptor subunit TctC
MRLAAHCPAPFLAFNRAAFSLQLSSESLGFIDHNFILSGKVQLLSVKPAQTRATDHPTEAGGDQMAFTLKKFLVAATAVLSISSSYAADDFPNKPITMVVPFAAGGPTDTVARLVAQAMSVNLKQTVLVENVGGAGGTVGAGRVARAPGDGYTVLLHHIGHSTAPSLYRKLAYSPTDDFEAIGLVTDVPMTFVARKDFPAKNMQELIAYVKTNKDKVTYANAGIGSASHLCGMLFMTAIQTDLTTVPYKGTGPAMNDLLGGQVDFMCDQTTNTTSQIKGGKIKAYSVTTKTKVPSLPDLPTVDSSGLPGFEVAVWHGLYAPKGTPAAIVERLDKALQAALQDATVKQRFADLGTEPVAMNRATPEALRAHLRREVDKWGPIIKKAGIYAD